MHFVTAAWRNRRPAATTSNPAAAHPRPPSPAAIYIHLGR